MPSNSRSPSPRHRSRFGEESRSNRSDSRRENFSDDYRPPKRQEYRDSRSNNSRRHDRPSYRQDYKEEDRERERKRDRDIYTERARGNRDTDTDNPSRSSHHSRRSASPPSRQSRRATSRSRSDDLRENSPADKAKPNFAPSGLLAAETNTVKAVDGTKTILKYNEPPEARKPILGWRLYVFKGSEQVELLHIHRQSAYLFGRDRLVADIAVDHPSCSKQHAVIQFRYIQETNEFRESKGLVKPFIIDLESTNGTHVNDEAIPPARYYELKASDVIKFGQSTREYVLLHDEAT